MKCLSSASFKMVLYDNEIYIYLDKEYSLSLCEDEEREKERWYLKRKRKSFDLLRLVIY